MHDAVPAPYLTQIDVVGDSRSASAMLDCRQQGTEKASPQSRRHSWEMILDPVDNVVTHAVQ
jgi:hypothetical protein